MSQSTKALATRVRGKAVPYVLKANYLQVTVKGEPYALHSSHPTFNRLKRAIKEKKWRDIPRLVNIAKHIMDASHGEVAVRNGVVFYKGKEIKSSLATRIREMVMEGKDVKHMLRFMDNLYMNPSQRAIDSFYEWLEGNDLPITDDGCFLAYKSVRENMTDTHSGKIDNSPGQTIMMPRAVADSDYDQQCSTGFHVRSKHYGTYGAVQLAVKVNPKHVLSAVEGKVRCTQYEVLAKLGTGTQLDSFDQLEKKLVIEVKKERKNLVKELLSKPSVKHAIKRKKMAKSSILKASYARIKTIAEKFGINTSLTIPKTGPEPNFVLMNARKVSGLTVGQVAKEMKVSYKVAATLEKKENPHQEDVDRYLMAVGRLTGRYNLSSSGITFPKPVVRAAAV